MKTERCVKNRFIPYIILLIILFITTISWVYLKNNIQLVGPLPNKPFAGDLINIPESQSEDFNINNLSKNSVFNWMIEGQANVGLAYNKQDGFNLMADVADRSDNSKKPKHKFFQYNNKNWPMVINEGKKFLAAYGYKIDFNNSEELKLFIEFMNQDL